MSTLTKTAVKSDQKDNIQSGLDTVTKGSIITMGVFSSLVGLWAVACFIGAMMTGGGPLELAQKWFSAITGM